MTPTANPERRAKPIGNYDLANYVTQATGTGTGTSAAAAYAAALANLSAYAPFVGFPFALGEKSGSGTSWNATVTRAKFQIACHGSYCYFKAWWNEVVRDGTGTLITSTPKTFTWVPVSVAGYCVPDLATFNPGDSSTWSISTVMDLLETEPPANKTYNTTFEDLVYSLLDGYVPVFGVDPDGFPA